MPGQGRALGVQAELLSHLATRAVVPLLPADGAPTPIHDLNPVFAIEGTAQVMVTQAIASIPSRDLKRMMHSLARARYRVTRALDLLLVGF